MLTIAVWFLFFIFYSFSGWLYESALCSIREKKLINRGFLSGPLCPIYGLGAVFILLILGNITNIFTLFIAGSVITCTLEYISSIALEKLFNAKWWDYSSYPFNIKGRVCLWGAIVFGAFSVVLVRFIDPFVRAWLISMSSRHIYILSVFLLAALLADIIFTAHHLLILGGRLKEIQTEFNHFVKVYSKHTENLKASLLEKFEESEYYTERIKNLFSLNKFQNLRLMRAFPKLRPINTNEAWQKLKSFLMSKDKKD